MSQKHDQIKEAISKIPDEGEEIDAFVRTEGYFDTNDENSGIYSAIQSYLSGVVDITEAIDKITGPIDATLGGDAGRNYEYEADVFHCLLHSATRTSFRNVEQHSKLVALLRAYKSHPEPTQDKPSHFYDNLEGFGLIAREAVNGGPGLTQIDIHAWANLNYFFARITSDGVVDWFWIYCIWMMREALEYSHKDDTGSTASQKYDSHVPAAAVWVFALGKQLYDREEDLSPTRPGQGNPGRGGNLWNGRPEFSKARWALWKKRFGEISDMNGVSNETRAIAKEAYNAMAGCEET